jgi:hypothetical protein
MNDDDLSHILKRAASILPAALPASMENTIMARVRNDDGRAKRWRSFVQWLLILATGAAVATASMIGWTLASRDTTHTTPPTMNLFREGLPK